MGQLFAKPVTVAQNYNPNYSRGFQFEVSLGKKLPHLNEQVESSGSCVSY
jgi:hypothetical protein